ncbi:TonB-dependent receptor [Pedobacter sp. Leaf132]|uniref:TonB-dependent receptor n=1 Tax=Pedobacter sp. Leaf132 TaxID=2876557 RepID=UPI001E37F3EC|nr:TonB-dependent receptor [Pedobacter sp. Leaf132]
MQFKKILLTGMLCAFVIFTYAQNLTSSVSGYLKTSAGEALSGATVRLLKSNFATVTDTNGYFRLARIPQGNYHISISAIGYKPIKKDFYLIAGIETKINLSISEDAAHMETVNVLGRTKAQEVNRQAFNVTAIDAKKLYNTTLDISGALDKVAGIRVRESGGVGSNFNVSLNGFSGRHIRYFIDGVPMDNFGSSFQINNIPINLAERVEVYKGVVPIWLGSDALGGAINIVTNNSQRNYLDASYSYGSFNTHRSVINTAVTTKSGLTFQINAFQNYSDNNYRTDLRLLLQNDMQPELRAASVKRFHDNYHNETLIANAGVVGKSWADNFLIGMTLGKNYKEIQTAARPEAVYGQVHRRGNIVMPSLKYKKVNLLKGLDVTINANYNFGYENTIDTARADYDWDGIRDPKVSMGERGDGGQYSEYRNNNGLATGMVNYQISEHQSFAINNVYSTFNRRTDNLLFPDRNVLDPAKTMHKNVLGFGYSYAMQNQWNLNVFGKYITLKSVIGSINRSNNDKKLGYGMALSYYIMRDLQLRGSYELTNRMPEANEIFGNLENEAANPLLKPEKSDNLNLGIVYGFKLNEVNRFSITANAIYRYSADFIFSRFVGGTSSQRDFTIWDNRDGVRTTGLDGEIRYSFKNWLTAGATVTYQKLINLQQYDYDPNAKRYYTIESLTYLDQMPNIPFFFGNADISGTFKDVFVKGNNLTIGYNLLYVHDFWLDWPSFGSPDTESKYGIPAQVSHDANFVYSFKNGRYNVSFEVRNIADKPVFDNFALQKPGRSFYLNLRYFINKSRK